MRKASSTFKIQRFKIISKHSGTLSNELSGSRSMKGDS
ncbi:hypothetical protein LINPERPRIM_LOCUS20683 [Linum perenne]